MDNSCFYYGANTADGVHSGIFEPEKIEKKLVVKGGSPELKDKIFIELSEELVQKSIQNEMLFSFENCCGIYCAKEKILIADEKILKEKQIENAEKIIDLNELFSETIPKELLHIYEKEYDKKIKRSGRFLSAADSVKKDAMRIDAKSVNIGSVVNYSSKLWKKLGAEMQGSIGTETRKFVSCITPDGAELNMKAFDACERLAVIVDKTGAVSTMIIDRLRRYALGSGYDVVSCICSLDGKTVEHIIVPELSFGAFSSEHYHRILPKKERRVFASRFHTTDSELYKNRINFSLKAYRSLMNEAFESLIGAQTEERKINYIFGNIVDVYDAVTEIIESI
jgi:hypothetical protein